MPVYRATVLYSSSTSRHISSEKRVHETDRRSSNAPTLLLGLRFRCYILVVWDIGARAFVVPMAAMKHARMLAIGG